MLETTKKLLNEIESNPQTFDSYYQEYVKQVQDSILIRESSISHNQDGSHSIIHIQESINNIVNEFTLY